MAVNGISKATLDRLPVYLTYLKSLPQDAPQNISATSIAAALKLGEVQVRKDLASVSGAGKPKIGYIVVDLICELESFLGYNDMNDVFLVGCGRLGQTLLGYDGFEQYGMNIVAGFDNRSEIVGKTVFGKEIFPIEKFEDLCERMKISIAIIAVPESQAQQVCDMMINCKIKGIMNFAPVHLSVPSGIIVQNEDLAAELAKLSGKLAKK